MKSRTLLASGLFVVVARAAALVSAATGAAGRRADDALTAARFSITIDGAEIATFSELGGLTTGIDPSDLTLLTEGQTIELKKLPGKRTPPTLTLKRGMSNSLELWDWQEAALAGSGGRKEAQFVIYATDGRPVARYHLEDAWPAKLEIGALKAGSSEVLMEAVTIVSERMQRVSV